jgi:hypothetical protein
MLSNHLYSRMGGTCSRHINQNGGCAAPTLQLRVENQAESGPELWEAIICMMFLEIALIYLSKHKFQKFQKLIKPLLIKAQPVYTRRSMVLGFSDKNIQLLRVAEMDKEFSRFFEPFDANS